MGRYWIQVRFSNGGPIKIQLGMHQVFSGFEESLLGMEVGEQREVLVPPEKSYGDFDPILLEKVPRSQFPEGKEIPINKQIEYIGSNGMMSPAWVRLVEEDVVIIDMNHPLAGKTIKITLKLVETGLEPDPITNPFQIGMSCDGACGHEHDP